MLITSFHCTDYNISKSSCTTSNKDSTHSSSLVSTRSQMTSTNSSKFRMITIHCKIEDSFHQSTFELAESHTIYKRLFKNIMIFNLSDLLVAILFLWILSLLHRVFTTIKRWLTAPFGQRQQVYVLKRQCHRCRECSCS